MTQTRLASSARVAGEEGRRARLGTAIAGAALEEPSGVALDFPWLDVSGWVVGHRVPIDRVEFTDHDGRVFATVPVDRSSPDLVPAFPNQPWASRARFSARISLVAAGDQELHVRAGLPGSKHAIVGTIGRRSPVAPPAMPVVVALDLARDGTLDHTAILDQTGPLASAYVRGAQHPLGHPGFTVARDLNRVLDDPVAAVWVAGADDPVTSSFAEAGSAALARHPAAAFAVAVPAVQLHSELDLVRALSGTSLGAAALFRASALRTIGGIDEASPNGVVAQWDLAIRLVAAGHMGVQVAAARPGAQPLRERAGDAAARWLYVKHADLYERHLEQVLLDCELGVGRLLGDNARRAREIAELLAPQLTGRRRERNRLASKLRAGPPDSGRAGDLRRLEPFGDGRLGQTIEDEYLRRFLDRYAGDLCGTVVELREPADEERIRQLGDGECDCVLALGVLERVIDPRRLLLASWRVLRPGGTLLVTVRGAVALDRERLRDDRWRFSELGLRCLLEYGCGAGSVEVSSYGGRVAIAAALTGLPAAALEQAALDQRETNHALVIGARAIKPTAENPRDR